MKEESNPDHDKLPSTKPPLVPGEDYYINESGYLVFTAVYHLKRGYCCTQGCKHCPYRNTDDK